MELEIVTTAVFSTCGMGIFTFSLAAILSLPKQFVTVYLGVILEQSESGAFSSPSRLPSIDGVYFDQVNQRAPAN